MWRIMSRKCSAWQKLLASLILQSVLKSSIELQAQCKSEKGKKKKKSWKIKKKIEQNEKLVNILKNLSSWTCWYCTQLVHHDKLNLLGLYTSSQMMHGSCKWKGKQVRLNTNHAIPNMKLLIPYKLLHFFFVWSEQIIKSSTIQLQHKRWEEMLASPPLLSPLFAS